MEPLFLLVPIIFLLIIIVFRQSKSGNTTKSDQELFLMRKTIEQQQELSRLLSQQIISIESNVRNKLDQHHEHFSRTLQTQSRDSLDVIKGITEHLTKLDETNKQVISFTDQLKDLQDILKNPKQRGILGEYYLETTLKNVLPPNSYTLQFPFSNGTIVDAVVHVKDKIIPIDSKFSLENYNRLRAAKNDNDKMAFEKAFKQDLKTRIDETSKYIDPNENTMDFAFMFIPHESLYYDLLVAEIGEIKVDTQDLIEYAFKKRVLLVSPTSLLAFLQTVLQGLKALQIEETAKEIQKRVGELGKHLAAYEEFHSKLGNSLGTAVNHFNKSRNELLKIDKDVMRISGDDKNMREDIYLSRPSDDDFE